LLENFNIIQNIFAILISNWVNWTEFEIFEDFQLYADFQEKFENKQNFNHFTTLHSKFSEI
jgi:hypothetical protein